MPFIVLFLVPLAVFWLFWRPFLSVFWRPFNFLTRFYGLALRRLLVALFGRSVFLYPAYFLLKPFLHELEL